MVAYSFERRFIEPIKIGLVPGPPAPLAKRQTIRAERRRHARPGERVQLFFAMRTKQCQFLGEPRCVGVWPIHLTFNRPQALIERMPSPEGAAELDAFARRDGFGDWADLAAFWAERHGRTVASSFQGLLIIWLP
jgi:hypothetical protein